MTQDVTRTAATHAKGYPLLLGFHAYGHAKDFRLAGRQTLGRAATTTTDDAGAADIAVPCAYVSALHGEFGLFKGNVFYRDLGSTNGTLVNGRRCCKDVRLTEGDVLGFAPGGNADSVAFKLVLAHDDGEEFSWQRIELSPDVHEIVVGRLGPGARGLAIGDPTVSHLHASFFQSSKGLAVFDHQSKNGVFVNGRRMDGWCRLREFDIVRVGNAWFAIYDGYMWMGVPASMRVKSPTAARPEVVPEEARGEERRFEGDSLFIDIVERSVWSRVAKKTLLKDISITVEPGDMVLILGGSGAGKSTFIKAVMGYDKAKGSVRYGDLDVYEEYDQLRYEIGYVPQNDLLRMNDTVEMTLLAAAQMRMPGNPTLEECEAQADWACETLGLGPERQTMVKSLSGGQRKRLSIAVELVGNPSLFFLDEPDSGLDGIMARDLMSNLRKIADMGKMVLVITHGPDRAAALFTKVLVLAKSERDGTGHLAFYGTVEDAKTFFGVETLEGIVRCINRTDEGGDGLADYYLDKASKQFGYPRIDE